MATINQTAMKALLCFSLLEGCSDFTRAPSPRPFVTAIPPAAPPPGARQPQSSALVATIMVARLTSAFDGAEDQTEQFEFFIDPDRIIIVEPSLSDRPGEDNEYQGLMLDSIGEWKCREKYNPAFDPNVKYSQACGRLISRTANSFVMDHVFRSMYASGVQVVWQSRVGVQRDGITCQARLLSHQRTFWNRPGVFMSPTAMKSQHCRAL